MLVRSIFRRVLNIPRFCFHDELVPPRANTRGLYWEDKKVRRLVYNKPVKKESFADELKLPDSQFEDLGKLYFHVMKSNIQNFTSSSIAALTYNFSREDLMTPNMFDRLYGQLNKFEGEFTTRSLFGFIWSAVKYSNEEYLAYFLENLESGKHAFTPGEAIEMIEALRLNQTWSIERKKDFWNKHFLEQLQQFMLVNYKDNNPKRVMRVLRNLQYLEVYDQGIWAKLIKLLHNKRGWVRLEIYELLSRHMERFPQAQQLVDIIYQQVSNNPDVLWRYNLVERRLYTNAEMIAKSQQNITLIPPIQSLFSMEYVDELNKKFELLKKTGTLLEEAQIQHDKAKSLAYVLYDKFNRDKEEGDVSAEVQYERLYGMNEQEIKQLIAEAEKEELEEDSDEDDSDEEGEQQEEPQEEEEGESSEQEQQEGQSSEEESSSDQE